MVVKKPLEKINVNVEELIDRGARIKEDNKEEKKFTHINLRMPTSMLTNIDECMKQRVGISRNGWVLESIQEKLKKGNL